VKRMGERRGEERCRQVFNLKTWSKKPIRRLGIDGRKTFRRTLTFILPGWVFKFQRIFYEKREYSFGIRAGRSGDRIPVGGEIFSTRPDRPWGLPSLLYNGYRVIPGGKAAGAWSWLPTPI
jgi:hypothetical protein